MKILTWNCNGALRLKFPYLLDFNADICVIQECENPIETKDIGYRHWAENHLWTGDNKNKGIGIFANEKIKLQKLHWSDNHLDQRVKYFLPCRVDQDFELLAVWTHSNNSPTFGYIGQFWKYLQVNKIHMKKILILGDLNSNVFWDRNSRWWNHSDVVRELNDIEIHSLYHKYWNEVQGKESRPTFFLHRDLQKPYHIDYVFGSDHFKNKLLRIEFGDVKEWIGLSDHLPVVCEFQIKTVTPQL